MMTLNEFFFGGNAATSPRAIYHLGRAVSMVNERLETEDALSNSTLAVVNLLIVQELLRESRLKAEVHLEGLKKMIELRGGLSQLGDDNTFVLKVCKYVLPSFLQIDFLA